MQSSMEFRGKTTDDALTKALSALGKERDDVSVEILERGKTGFFGIGAVPAVIRVTYETADIPADPLSVSSDPGPEPLPEKKPGLDPGAEKRPAPGPAPERKPAPRPAPEKRPAPVPAPEKSPAPAPVPQAEEMPSPPESKARRAEGTQSEQTEAFLKGLLEHMGVHAEIDITPREGGGLNVELSGSGIGAVIGRRGETLDAIQHLTNYAVNRGSDRRAHINVDAEHYRSKREDSLVRLAQKMAEKAIRYKRSMALEPMNSYERHVIHTALQDYEGVTTSSTGSEPNRRVVISYVRPESEQKQDRSYKEWC